MVTIRADFQQGMELVSYFKSDWLLPDLYSSNCYDIIMWGIIVT